MKTWFILNAIIAVLVGLGLVLVPATSLSLYGITLDLAGQGIARLLGVMFIGFAIVAWQARDTEDSPARRAIVAGFFASSAIGFVVSLIGQFLGVANALGWIAAAVYLVFAVAYGYFGFARPES